MSYRVSGRARRDLHQIWRYIAQDNEQAADRFIDLLVQRFKLLAGNPYAEINCAPATEASQSGNTLSFIELKVQTFRSCM